MLANSTDQSMLYDSNVKLTHLLAKILKLQLWCVCIQISTVIQSLQHNAPIAAQAILAAPRPCAVYHVCR